MVCINFCITCRNLNYALLNVWAVPQKKRNGQRELTASINTIWKTNLFWCYCATLINLTNNTINISNWLSVRVYIPHSNPLPTMEERVTEAVDFMLQIPNASVSESMAAVQIFNATERSYLSLQQWVRCYHKMRLAAVPATVILSGNTRLNMSPLTDPSFLSLQKIGECINGCCITSLPAVNSVISNFSWGIKEKEEDEKF